MNYLNNIPPPTARPRHVAIIMDGNGRWACKRGLARLEGHRKGAEVVRDITTFARELEISHLTLFSFSVQNWQRPADEVSGLMDLLGEYCAKELPTLMENDIRLATIGNMDRLPTATQKALNDAIEETTANRAMTLTLAIDYGGREEIVAAIQRIAQDVKRKRLKPENIDEAVLETRLQTALLPDPDFLIRTSGEMRLSNFLLWQIAYTEFYFTDIYWPDFTRNDFINALKAFACRERRFGATSQQVLTTPEDTEKFSLGDLPNVEDAICPKGF